MRLLFVIDTKDYDLNGRVFSRPSARAILIRNRKIAMVHSLKYDYYKFPGGGIEPGETKEEALIRETQEEAGMCILPQNIHPYGYVHRIGRSDQDDFEIFLQDNYYYFCKAENFTLSCMLDDYEEEEKFTLEWVCPETAVQVNRQKEHGPKSRIMIEREAKVLRLLMEEGYFETENKE